MTETFFWLSASVGIGSALLCVTRRSPVASALWLVMTLVAVAAMYVMLDAHFIAAIQVLVYAGAIMVLFLFVIMLLNLGRTRATDMRGWVGRVVGLVLAAVLVVELWAFRNLLPNVDLQLPAGEIDRLTTEQGAINVVAEPLFRTYLVPFEITSVLLLAAIAGAVVLAKRRL